MDDLERQLRARLRGPELDVPAAVDAAVLGAGRQAAMAFGRRRRFVRLASCAAAAALLAVAVWLGVPRGRGFDVADAWRVAQGLEQDRAFDRNGDGRVDRADAREMLRAIVALEPRRGS